MTHNKFENFDTKTQGTIDNVLTSINSLWHTWFPSAGTTTTGGTTTGGTTTGGGTTGGGDVLCNDGTRQKDCTEHGGKKTYTPPPPPRSKTLIYVGVGLGVLGVGYLIYKKMNK